MSVASFSTPAAPPAPARDPREEELANVVPSPLRADLIMQRQFFRGREYYVIKDPLALTYFRLQYEEGFLISLLDGKRTLREVAAIFNRRFPNRQQTIAELAAFTNQMSTAGLLNINARRFVSVARTKPNVKAGWLMVWAKLFSTLLFLRVPLLDPSAWLGKLTHRIRFIWSRTFVGLCLAFIAWSAVWLFINRSAFAENTINFFSPENLFLIWLTVIVVKTFHEFGHATTCRYFGGEVHEMGVCLICFAPAGYVDASDAWMMREKRHKLYTTLAGVFTEFVIAGIAAHLWLYLPPGLAKDLAFNTMIVASVNTVFFNANPLMKFDGYYVVSDLLEIPNLRAKAMAYCSYHIQRWLLGFRNLGIERALEDERNNRAFAIYAIVAYLYMIVIVYSLSQVFARLLAPYGLHEFGLILGIFVQASFLMFPIIKIASDAISADRKDIIREERLGLRLARWMIPLAIGLGIVAFLPTRYEVEQQAVLVASRADQAGAEVAGIVSEVHVRTGQWVEAGDPLVTLDNPEVVSDERVSQLMLETAKIRLASLQSDNSLRASSLVPNAVMGVETARTALERAQRLRDLLVVRAPVSGYVVTPDIERLQGRYLGGNSERLRVADLSSFKLLIPLTESQAELVELGSEVAGRLRAGAVPIKTKITTLPSHKAAMDDYHPSMLVTFGGPAPYEYADPRETTGPRFGLFIAEAELPNLPPTPVEGLRVKVEIAGKKTTYGQRVWRWVLGLWHSRSST